MSEIKNQAKKVMTVINPKGEEVKCADTPEDRAFWMKKEDYMIKGVKESYTPSEATIDRIAKEKAIEEAQIAAEIEKEEAAKKK